VVPKETGLKPFIIIIELVMGLLIFGAIHLLTPHLAKAAEVPPGTVYAEQSYKIGPGDVMSTNIYGQSDLSQLDVLVRKDGYASFNGVGPLFVAGKTVEEVNALLTLQLEALVLNPRVSISILKTHPGTLYVNGAVKNPGSFPITTASTQLSNTENSASQLLADSRLTTVLKQAGGLWLNADIHHIQIQFADGSQKTVDLWRLLSEGDASQDVLLSSQDSIMVPFLKGNLPKEEANKLLQASFGPGGLPVRVIGEVNTPGFYELAPYSAFINSALSRAGGAKLTGNLKQVTVRRFDQYGAFSTFDVDAQTQDLALEPNDVIYVSETKMAKRSRVLSLALAPFTSASTVLFGIAATMNAFKN
jgi:polysaccharide biosynthesis/export protein